ncbi:MAG: hypothetical protein U0746_18165 [Gemmataceae bacterium]
MTSDPAPVRTLLGAKGFDASLTCLGSLIEYSADPVRLVVHDDGTLTDECRQRVREIDARAEFVDRAAADAQVLGLLAKYPRCSAFRRTEIMALKLFDIALLAGGPVAYCDSDFLFLRPYTGLFATPAPDKPVFMTDVGHAYAVRPWHLWPAGRRRLIGRLNAGITLAPGRLPRRRFRRVAAGHDLVRPSIRPPPVLDGADVLGRASGAVRRVLARHPTGGNGDPNDGRVHGRRGGHSLRGNVPGPAAGVRGEAASDRPTDRVGAHAAGADGVDDRDVLDGPTTAYVAGSMTAVPAAVRRSQSGTHEVVRR